MALCNNLERGNNVHLEKRIKPKPRVGSPSYHQYEGKPASITIPHQEQHSIVFSTL